MEKIFNGLTAHVIHDTCHFFTTPHGSIFDSNNTRDTTLHRNTKNTFRGGGGAAVLVERGSLDD